MTNQQGMDTINSLQLSIGSETTLTDIRYYDEDKEDDFLITEEMLNTPFAASPQIVVKMPHSTAEELAAFENSDFDQDLFAVPRTVKAKDGQTVTVRDVLEEWAANNLRIQNLEDKIKEGMKANGENPPNYFFLFGDHVYFEGITDLGNNVYTMEDYGS